MTTKLTALKSLQNALIELQRREEQSAKPVRDRKKKVITWALQYGKSLGVTREEIDILLSQPLETVFDLNGSECEVVQASNNSA